MSRARFSGGLGFFSLRPLKSKIPAGRRRKSHGRLPVGNLKVWRMNHFFAVRCVDLKSHTNRGFADSKGGKNFDVNLASKTLFTKMSESLLATLLKLCSEIVGFIAKLCVAIRSNFIQFREVSKVFFFVMFASLAKVKQFIFK